MLSHLSKICGTKSQIHRQVCIEAIDLTGGKDYFPLTVAIIQVVHGGETPPPPPAVFTKLNSVRGPFHVQPSNLFIRQLCLS
jgi:hypothetical protein